MRRQRWCAAVAVVVAAALVAACGGDKKESPLAAIRNASSATAAAKTAKMTMHIQGGQGGLANSSFDGVFDFGAHYGSFTIDGSKLGVGSGKIPTVMDFRESVVEYMKIPGLDAELKGKHWLKVDLAKTIQNVCPDFDFAGLLKAQSGDPTSGLRMLDGADSVTTVGKEKLRGEQTTHYRAVVDINKAAERVPADARATMRQLAAMYANPKQTSDVWLDSDGRVRKYEQTTDASTLKLPACLDNPAARNANPFKGKTTFGYEMYDFGTPVKVEIPAESDAADFQQLMGQS